MGKASAPSVRLGTWGQWPLRFPLDLTGLELAKHKHIMGTTGVGKSMFNAHIAVSLITAGLPCSVIDPHADLVHEVLGLLSQTGFFQTPEAYKKLLYVEFKREGRAIPFNILKQPYDMQTTVRNVLEAVQRVFPALGDGAAPNFENILQYTAVVLAQNHLPVTQAGAVLTDKSLRERLLESVTHEDTIAFFHTRFDRWADRDRADRIESTLNKLSILTFTDNMRYALGHSDNTLNFRALIDQGISVLFNISNLDDNTRNLVGSLIMVGFEQATLSRADIPEYERAPYHILVDEFPLFTSRSEETFTTFLSEARKFHVTLWLSHQDGSQISQRFHSALQNALPIFFHVGHPDSLWAVQIFGRYDPYRVKHTVKDEAAEERTHPVFWGLPEQIDEMAKIFEDLREQEAYIKLAKRFHFQRGARILKFKTHTIRKKDNETAVTKLRQTYADLLLEPFPTDPMKPPPAPQTPTDKLSRAGYST